MEVENGLIYTIYVSDNAYTFLEKVFNYMLAINGQEIFMKFKELHKKKINNNQLIILK